MQLGSAVHIHARVVRLGDVHVDQFGLAVFAHDKSHGTGDAAIIPQPLVVPFQPAILQLEINHASNTTHNFLQLHNSDVEQLAVVLPQCQEVDELQVHAVASDQEHGAGHPRARLHDQGEWTPHGCACQPQRLSMRSCPLTTILPLPTSTSPSWAASMAGWNSLKTCPVRWMVMEPTPGAAGRA